jgi:hypothetical protein
MAEFEYHAASIPYHDCLVLLDNHSDHLRLLNPVARQIWEWTVAGQSQADIISNICDTYGIDNATASADSQTILAQWESAGLINRAGNPRAVVTEIVSDNPDNPDFILSAKNNIDIKKFYSIAGISFGIHYRIEDMFIHIHSLFQHFESDQPAADTLFVVQLDTQAYVLLRNDEERLRDVQIMNISGALFEDILHLMYPGNEWIAIMHAAAIANKDKIMVMPAESGSGKSTLSAALMYAGYNYLGDDVVPLRRGDFNVTPFITSLSIKEGSWDIIGKLYPRLHDNPEYVRRDRRLRYLNLDKASIEDLSTHPVHCLAFPRYDSESEESLQQIEPTMALARLIEAGIWLGHPLEPGRIKQFLDWLDHIPCYSMTYRSLSRALDWSKKLLES